MINIKRAYDPVGVGDGTRVLVDRLWPRGLTKEKARIDVWAKEAAPSSDLRKWFHADRDYRFKEFSRLYSKELDSKEDELRKLRSMKGEITLVTASKEIDLSHVPTLLDRLNRK